MREQEYESFYLKDFVYFALKGWRKILVFAIITAMLFSAVAYYRNSRRDKDVAEPEEFEDEIVLTDEEISALRNQVISSDFTVLKHKNRVAYLSNSFNKLCDRLNNSIYLSLNANSFAKASFVLELNLENTSGETDEIMEQRQLLLAHDYLRLTRNTAFYEYLAKRGDVINSSSYISELLQIRLAEDNSIYFEFIASDINAVRRMSAAAEEYMLERIDSQLGYSYPHSIGFIDQEYAIVSDPEVAEDKSRSEAEYVYLQGELERNQEELDNAIEEALERESLALIAEKAKEMAEMDEEENILAKSSKTSLAFYSIAGLFVGALIAILWNFYRGSSSSKLLHPDDFARRTDLLYINEIYLPHIKENATKKGLALSVDKYLEKRYLNKKLDADYTLESGVAYAASVITGLSERLKSEEDISLNKVAVMTTDDEAVDSVLTALTDVKAESGKNYKLIPLEHSVHDSRSIDAISSADSALIILRSRRTDMSDLLRSLEMIQELKKPVLGIISVEALSY